jgi:type I restriction enzyme S subunit
MKDSDVEWIGEVPEHWDIRRIKDVCSINDQTIGANENPQREILYVDISSVNFLHGITSKEPLPLADAPSRARRVVKDGDVIVSTVRTYLRAIANIENPEPNLIVSTGFAVLRPKGLLASYAGYAFRTSFFIERIVCESTGVSYPAINSSEIASFDIPTPPEDEQQLITKYLDKKCSEIDAICSALNKQVNALTELRKTLINDVVTGKIKVA